MHHRKLYNGIYYIRSLHVSYPFIPYYWTLANCWLELCGTPEMYGPRRVAHVVKLKNASKDRHIHNIYLHNEL